MNFKIGIAVFLLSIGVRALNGEPVHAEEHGGGHYEESQGGHDPVEVPSFTGKQIVVQDPPSDFRVPPKLWDQLLSHTAVKEMQQAEEGREDEQQGSNILFSPLKVRLTEKNPGVLVEPMVEFVFPRGGGEIDLSQVTTGQAGTFFVQFDLDGIMKDPSFEAFHLSRAKKRRFEKRIFGGGCRSFTKITSILRQADSKGLPFNTTQDLHLSALGGNFLFSWANADAVNVTQVRFFDSKKSRFSCEGE